MSALDEPAFPQGLAAGALAKVEGGMTLRDYFAGQVLPALVEESKSWPSRPEGTVAAVVFASYEIADAMLAERIK